jgi:large subunit ribosomal protein L21
MVVSTGTGVTAKVTAEIVSDLVKGDKVIAFKMKRRKGFRKKLGHRTQYTQIRIQASRNFLEDCRIEILD